MSGPEKHSTDKTPEISASSHKPALTALHEAWATSRPPDLYLTEGWAFSCSLTEIQPHTHLPDAPINVKPTQLFLPLCWNWIKTLNEFNSHRYFLYDPSLGWHISKISFHSLILSLIYNTADSSETFLMSLGRAEQLQQGKIRPMFADLHSSESITSNRRERRPHTWERPLFVLNTLHTFLRIIPHLPQIFHRFSQWFPQWWSVSLPSAC